MKIVVIVIALFSACAHADLADKLSRLEGYTIAKAGTITGWQNSNGERGDSFEGCEYGRKLFIDNDLQVTCSDYFYEYAYSPTVVILAKRGALKMVIGNDIHDVLR